MGSVNQAFVIGYLGQTPEVKETATGKKLAKLSVATNEAWTDASGQRQERTEWHHIVAWGRQAEIAGQYLTKGRLIAVRGRVQTRQWKDKEGHDRTSTEIVADDITFLGARGESTREAA